MNADCGLKNQDEQFMQHALELARRAEQEGEVPVGAVLVKDNAIVAEGWNRPISGCDPTAHAEIQALRAAGQTLGNYRLVDTTLYVTLEPCIMCIGAIMHARVRRLVYASSDPRAGAIHSAYTIPDDAKLNHAIEVESGVLADECSSLLTNFFRARRS
ncbi:tRNA adenosine(34) deaminase TadA [Sulfuriflexus mobilis]|uniref:tRNA adenosine(34) deaminase TadA n=1 Tax=Sulfuriflexus mobilis TaxID=1811807 RepID=UPI000F82E0C9|nr:tRNA adenosine(34) deaminase TadA [Sulfuriflexus mobilis]